MSCIRNTIHFTGLGTLKIKETDRIEAMKREMEKLGYILHEEEGTALSWTGERCEPMTQPTIDTYEDHRMAMSFAPLAIKFRRDTHQQPRGCV